MEFQHHPDGIIYIRTDTSTYADTTANFALDVAVVGLAPMPSLPVGVLGRRYVQGKFHALTDGSSQNGGDMPWAFGDTALGKFAELVAAKAARDAAALAVAGA